MKRRVIKQGNNTLTITLPKKWTEDTGIKAGDEVEVHEDGNSLVIGGKHAGTSETTIRLLSKDIPEDKEKNPHKYTVRVILVNVLKKNPHRVRVIFDSPKMLNIINSCVDEMIGYEIVEQSSKDCIIECVSDLKDIDYTKQLARLNHIINNFSAITYKNIVGNENNIEEIESNFRMLEKNWNTFSQFLLHECKKNTKEKMFLFSAAKQIYESARNMYYSAKLRSELKGNLSKETLKYAKEVYEYSRKVMDFIAKKDTNMILDLNVEKNEVAYYKINKLICTNSKENALLMQLCFVARRMWDAVGPYCGYII